MQPNQFGAYGPWAAAHGEKSRAKSALRPARFKTFGAWRKAAIAKTWECLAAPELPKTPKVTVHAVGEYDGLHFEKLSWQLPWGPRTEAVYLRPKHVPKGAKLPAILALHDHGGMKYFGWRKVAQVEPNLHPILKDLRAQCYEGTAWANEAAKRGYAVLCHDTFLFGSRGVKLSDVLPVVRGNTTDVTADEPSEQVNAYNNWAGDHEHLVAKSLHCAGMVWPGVYLREDQVALSILEKRPEVDASRLACAGLSGGGLRTVFLAGLDERIRTCCCAGFYSTWTDFLLYKAWTHTWMTYVPLLPQHIDFSEILALRAPRPTLVLNCTGDPLYTLSEVKEAGKRGAAIYKRAAAVKDFKLSHYPGGHQLDKSMQAEMWSWFERSLA